MKKIILIGCFCLASAGVNAQAEKQKATTRQTAPLATAEVHTTSSNVVAIGGNAAVNSVQVNAVAPAAAQGTAPVANPAPSHSIKMPTQSKDAPKHIRRSGKGSAN